MNDKVKQDEATKKIIDTERKIAAIKKVPLVKADCFLKSYGDADTYDCVYFNPATITTLMIKERENELILKDREGAWLFPNTKRTKKMLAMFFDYIDPAEIMGEEKE